MHPLPKHLRGVVSPAEEQEENCVEGKVVCTCKRDEFSLMYPGQTHEFDGQVIPCTAEISGNFFFILRADCLNCQNQHLLFDSHLHGWNGFICHEEEQARLPRPALVAWKCLECGGVGHKLDIRINGESQEEFEENAGEEYGLDAWPEAFGWISVSVSCTTCGKRTDDLVSYESM